MSSLATPATQRSREETVLPCDLERLRTLSLQTEATASLVTWSVNDEPYVTILAGSPQAHGSPRVLSTTLLPTGRRYPGRRTAGRIPAIRRKRVPARMFLAAWFVCALPGTPAHGMDSIVPDGAALTTGRGNDVSVYGLALNWNFSRPILETADNVLGVRLVGQAAYWHGDQRPTPNGSLWDFSLTPVLRWTAAAEGSLRPFVEGGVGVNLLTATRINNRRRFSTAFQFGEQVGGGVAFGPGGRYELVVYLQHVSNARIKEPNCGLTYPGITLRVALP